MSPHFVKICKNGDKTSPVFALRAEKRGKIHRLTSFWAQYGLPPAT